MDRYDPPDRPSIFSRPDDTERAPDPPSERPREPGGPSHDRRPRPAHSVPPGPVGPSRRFVIGLGVGGLLVLVIGGFVAASLFGPDDEGATGAASPTESASLTPPPGSSTTPTPTAQ